MHVPTNLKKPITKKTLSISIYATNTKSNQKQKVAATLEAVL